MHGADKMLEAAMIGDQEVVQAENIVKAGEFMKDSGTAIGTRREEQSEPDRSGWKRWRRR